MLSLHSTINAQKPVDIKHLEQEAHLFILDRCSFLDDSTGIGSNDILSVDQSNWTRISKERFINLGFPKNKLWLTFSLVNTDSVEHECFLVFANHVIRGLELFQNRNGRLFSYGKTGTDFPFHTRPYPFPVFIYPLRIEPHATRQYYLMTDPGGLSVQFSLMLFSKKDIRRVENRMYLIFGLFTGIILLVGLFNLFVFFALKENIHLLYFLYTLSTIWLIWSSEGLDFQFVFPNHPLLYIPGRLGSLFLSFSILLFVMQGFLRQTAANSIVFKWVWVVKWFCLLIALSTWPVLMHERTYPVISVIYSWITRIVPIVVIGLILISCIEKIKQRYWLAGFYLAAVFSFLAGALLNVLMLMGVFNALPMPPTLLETGIVIETIIISFGILYRYNFFKKEKELIAKQLHDYKISTSRQIIQAQEIEQKRIAEDLHDELGGNLAAIKMNIQSLSIPQEQAKVVEQLIDRASTNARNIAHNLMPPEFDQTDLQNMLGNYYQRLNTEGSIKFHFHSTGYDRTLSKEDELMIYRIFLELTNNIIKHSQATEATIQMITYEKYLELMAEDNGIGFSPAAKNGMGLKNINARINYLKGKMNIDSGGSGTTIVIQIPYNND
ncbi:MAG: hypothetical protein BGO55_27435 [Sphingobacteriales bacterium 50-39]|nr:MAG: hypothetical protein BGO55_27435 [Sphingobacteriales bacterium 50-39]